ncbi:uncharacterized protein BXZ73DRAFT_73983 [Epithele typhae]|uniref:uncharacterized protein n=1 Tax=Epithele typhae TaxID=378194 RepID=UPI0020074AAE|nr:uncharacterized protein BXZ73DRAFT_73983 [Epithele typhae]KAH9944477.1 hypothetical protein BXZ73DRAFT_73983 [Epithele typhae]
MSSSAVGLCISRAQRTSPCLALCRAQPQWWVCRLAATFSHGVPDNVCTGTSAGTLGVILRNLGVHASSDCRPRFRPGERDVEDARVHVVGTPTEQAEVSSVSHESSSTSSKNSRPFSRDTVIQVFGVLESVLSKHDWLLGDNCTVADTLSAIWNTGPVSPDMLSGVEGLDVPTKSPAPMFRSGAI